MSSAHSLYRRASPANTAIAVLAAAVLLLGLAICFVLRHRSARRSASEEALLDGGDAEGPRRRRSRFGLMTLSEYERAHGDVVALPQLRPVDPEAERTRLGTWARFHAFLG